MAKAKRAGVKSAARKGDENWGLGIPSIQATVSTFAKAYLRILRNQS
jgi:hypothetical protein